MATLFNVDIRTASDSARIAVDNNNAIQVGRFMEGAYKVYRIYRMTRNLTEALKLVDEDIRQAIEEELRGKDTPFEMGDSDIFDMELRTFNTEGWGKMGGSTTKISDKTSSGESGGGGNPNDYEPEEPEKNKNTTDSPSKTGRGKNYLKPNEQAEGDHTVFRTNNSDGVYKYETYTQNSKNPTGFDSSKRVDMTGDPHFNKKTGENIPVPHVQSKDIVGGVRPAKTTEIPSSFKGN